MTTRLSSPILALFAALAFIAAACSGGGDNGGSSGASQARFSDEEFVSAGTEVLLQSVASYGDEISSMQGEMDFQVSAAGMAFAGKATFAFEEASMHMRMEMDAPEEEALFDLGELGTFEVLVRDGKVYMNVPLFGGWIVFSPDEMGEDAPDIGEMLSRGSLIDYSALADMFGTDVEYVGDEDVGGVETAHYRVKGDLATFFAAFSDALAATGDTDLTEELDGVEGPITIDIWVGKADLLPYRVAADAGFDAGNEAGLMEMRIDARLFGYNEDVDIPAAPEDAQSLEDLFSGMEFEGE